MTGAYDNNHHNITNPQPHEHIYSYDIEKHDSQFVGEMFYLMRNCLEVTWKLSILSLSRDLWSILISVCLF